MTRKEFESEVLAGLGGRSVGDETILLSVSGSDYILVHKWIDRSIRRIARKHDFEALREENTSLTTTADIAFTALPSTTKSVGMVRIIDGASSYELIYKPPSWMDRYYSNPSVYGTKKPDYFTIKDAKLYFVAVPNATYTLWVDLRKFPANLSSDSAVPDFGTDLVDDVIIEYALGFGFASFGEAYKKDALFHFGLGDGFLLEAFSADTYVPAYDPIPDGYVPVLNRRYRRAYRTLGDTIPSGVTNPFRRW